VRRVSGLELVDEEELEGDESDKTPVAYLMVPDVRALRNLESLWQRWLRGELVRAKLHGVTYSTFFAISGLGGLKIESNRRTRVFSMRKLRAEPTMSSCALKLSSFFALLRPDVSKSKKS
jgi:hypothetical protein